MKNFFQPLHTNTKLRFIGDQPKFVPEVEPPTRTVFVHPDKYDPNCPLCQAGPKP